jgi:hypothetical protein
LVNYGIRREKQEKGATMKRTELFSIIGLLAGAIAGGGALAQDDPQFMSVEVFTCKYNDRQGPRNLDDVVGRWNRWMDTNGVDTYTAYTGMPHFYSSEQDFDFLWLGVSPFSEQSGAGTDKWLAEGGDVAAGFAAVATCDNHLNVASYMAKEPVNDGNPAQTPVISIANCKLGEGQRAEDIAAITTMEGQRRAEAGSKAGTWMWFPVHGGNAPDLDYVLVNGWRNHAEREKDLADYFANQGWNNNRRLYSGKVSCDVSRVYNLTLRRAAAAD